MLKVMVPAKGPSVGGVKVTEALVPDTVAWKAVSLLAPLAVKLTGTPPGLSVKAKVSAADVTPTGTDPKSREVRLRPTSTPEPSAGRVLVWATTRPREAVTV